VAAPARRHAGPDGRPLGFGDLVARRCRSSSCPARRVVVQLCRRALQGALVALDDRTIPTRPRARDLRLRLVRVEDDLADATSASSTRSPRGPGCEVAGAAAVVAAPWSAAVRAAHPGAVARRRHRVVRDRPRAGLGFFQVGGQGMADRFSYLPSIGLVTAVVWTIHETVRPRPRVPRPRAWHRRAAALAIVAHRQVGYWRNSETMLARTLAVTHDNWRMEEALGNVLANEAAPPMRRRTSARALAIEPTAAAPPTGSGSRSTGSAVRRRRRPVPRSHSARPRPLARPQQHGRLLLRHGDLDGALYHFSEAVRLNPGARDATDNLRATLAATGFTKEHADGYMQALVTWSAAIASDQQTIGGAAYGARLASALLASRARRFAPAPTRLPTTVRSRSASTCRSTRTACSPP
jgi:hypothetical protein